MSYKTRAATSGGRALWDQYETPAWPTRALCRRIDVRGMRVLEPCAGSGRMARVLREHGADVVTGDIDPAAPVDHHWNFCAEAVDGDRFRRRYGRFDAIITNPPYTTPTGTATTVYLRALEVLASEPEVRLALLLRTSWVDVVQANEQLLLTVPPTHILTLPRVGYHRTDGKGSSAGSQYPSAWMLRWPSAPWVGVLGVPKAEKDGVIVEQAELLVTP